MSSPSRQSSSKTTIPITEYPPGFHCYRISAIKSLEEDGVPSGLESEVSSKRGVISFDNKHRLLKKTGRQLIDGALRRKMSEARLQRRVRFRKVVLVQAEMEKIYQRYSLRKVQPPDRQTVGWQALRAVLLARTRRLFSLRIQGIPVIIPGIKRRRQRTSLGKRRPKADKRRPMGGIRRELISDDEYVKIHKELQRRYKAKLEARNAKAILKAKVTEQIEQSIGITRPGQVGIPENIQEFTWRGDKKIVLHEPTLLLPIIDEFIETPPEKRRRYVSPTLSKKASSESESELEFRGAIKLRPQDYQDLNAVIECEVPELIQKGESVEYALASVWARYEQRGTREKAAVERHYLELMDELKLDKSKLNSAMTYARMELTRPRLVAASMSRSPAGEAREEPEMMIENRTSSSSQNELIDQGMRSESPIPHEELIPRRGRGRPRRNVQEKRMAGYYKNRARYVKKKGGNQVRGPYHKDYLPVLAEDRPGGNLKFIQIVTMMVTMMKLLILKSQSHLVNNKECLRPLHAVAGGQGSSSKPLSIYPITNLL